MRKTASENAPNGIGARAFFLFFFISFKCFAIYFLASTKVILQLTSAHYEISTLEADDPTFWNSLHVKLKRNELLNCTMIS